MKSLHPEDKKLQRRTVFIKIKSAHDQLNKCAGLMKKFDASLPLSCYTNFRDALFHFTKINRLIDESEISNQVFAVEEHLSRAMTDAVNGISDYYLKGVAKILKDEEIADKIDFSQLRMILHKIKQGWLLIRLNGMVMTASGAYDVDKASLLKLFDDLDSLIFNSKLKENEIISCFVSENHS